MNIYINKSEIEAISNAWEEVNEKLECCDDMDNQEDLKKILRHLRKIEHKYKTKL